MVAAGGGGTDDSSASADGGDGGGLNGISWIYGNTGYTNASQTSGGVESGHSSNYKGGFGSGNTTIINAGSGGGSGYYGGGATDYGSMGGSSFISGYSRCNAIAESSTESNIVHTNQPNHYSGKIFANAIMIDGKGCNWSTGTATNCGTNQPQPDGTNAVGHSGNGYARITYLGNNNILTYWDAISSNAPATSENNSFSYSNNKLNIDFNTSDSSHTGVRVIFGDKISTTGVIHIKGNITVNSSSATEKSKVLINLGSSQRKNDKGEFNLIDNIDRNSTVSFEKTIEIEPDTYITLAIGRQSFDYSGSLIGTATIDEFYISNK